MSAADEPQGWRNPGTRRRPCRLSTARRRTELRS